jgi:hypothetical protein
MHSDEHVTTHSPQNFRPAPSVIYYPAIETFVNVGYRMVIFTDISVKNVSRQPAGVRHKAHPSTAHKVSEWGTGKALEMTYFRNGRHCHN